MRERFRRGLAIATATVYLACGVVTPAKAFAPPLVLGAAAVALPGGSYAGLSALVGLIGLTGLYLLLQDESGNKARIPLTSKPESQPPAPAAPATADSTQVIKYNGGTGTLFDSRADACAAAYAQHQQMNPAPDNYSYDGITDYQTCRYKLKYVPNDAYSTYVNLTIGEVGQPTCPKGYNLNGQNQCVLVNPRQSADDKTCDMLLSGGQFATADDMNCGATTDPNKLQPMVRDGKAVAYGKNNTTGQPLIFTVAPNNTVESPDYVTVKVQEQVQTDANTQVKTTTIQVNPDTGTIVGVQTQTSPGSVISPGTQTQPTANTPTSTTNSPTVKTGTDTTIDFETCGLPGKPACAVDDTGFANPSKPWESSQTPDFELPKKTITEWADPTIAWSDLLPKITPGSYTACHPLEFRGQVQQYGLDATTQLDICWIFEYVRMFLGWLFGVCTVIYVFRKFTNSQQAETI